MLQDVRVYDKKGRPVANLKESDFKVTEDGATQKINSFEVENVDKPLHAEGKAGSPENSGPSNRGAGGMPSEFALIFFRGNIQVSEAGPYPGKTEISGDHTFTYFTKIPLEEFPPGRYWMQANVLDPSAVLPARCGQA